MSTTNYERLTNEWKAMEGWHTYLAANPKARMSDYLREHKHCDSKDKSGEGHKSYVRHIQANGKAMAVPEAERIAWIQGQIKEYTTKAEIAKATGVTGGIRVKPGTKHHSKAEVLMPGAKAPKAPKGSVKASHIRGLAEAYKALLERVKEQGELDAKNPIKSAPLKARMDANTAIIEKAEALARGYWDKAHTVVDTPEASDSEASSEAPEELPELKADSEAESDSESSAEEGSGSD